MIHDYRIRSLHDPVMRQFLPRRSRRAAGPRSVAMPGLCILDARNRSGRLSRGSAAVSNPWGNFKPRIERSGNQWACHSGFSYGFGDTISQAFREWLKRL